MVYESVNRGVILFPNCVVKEKLDVENTMYMHL